jgi:hypothetical protein
MKQTKETKKVFDEAMCNYSHVQEAVKGERDQCLEDRRFYSISGAQWEGSLGEEFENKPKLEVNKIHLSIIKIINEYRNNRITVNFLSKDGTKDPSDNLAEVCEGLFRADEKDSGAMEAYDNAFEEAVGGGMGAMRLVSEYEDEEDDEDERQRIRIEPIYDADSSVFFDLDSKRQDKADAKYCFVVYSMTYEDFETEYGIAAADIGKDIDDSYYDWYSPDLIYVAEYYLVEMTKETVFTYEGMTGDKVKHTATELEDNPGLEEELAMTGYALSKSKKVKKQRVHKYILCGSQILEDCGYIAGKYIPIIPTYGKRWYIDSVERCMGHVRLAKDTQRIKNMLTSKLADISSLSAVEKPILLPEQVEGHEMRWAEDNIKNYPYLLINPVYDKDGNMIPGGPVAYTKPPSIPPALAALMQVVDVDMKEILGNYNEADQMISHVSGKAQELLQKRLDGQAYIYMSNFSKAIQRLGEVWLEMAKDVYVEKGRKMKIIDPSEEVSSVELQQEGYINGQVGEKNDVTKATFDVSVTVGPTSASQREATVKSIMGMLQITSDPETQKLLQNMALMNMEGTGISEARGYFRKKLVQAGVLKPTEAEAKAMAEEAANAEPDPNAELLKGMTAEAQGKAKKAEAEVYETLANTELIKAKASQVHSDIQTDRAAILAGNK